MPPKKVIVEVSSTEEPAPEKKPRKKRETKKKDDASSVGSKPDLGECTICCVGFNRSVNSKSVCPHCQVEICKSCVQTYLLGSLKDPHCMGCKNYWSQEILQDMTSKAFRTGDYKAHRQKVLMDREKGFLQLAQPYVEETGKARKYHSLLEKHNKTMEILHNYKDELMRLYQSVINIRAFERQIYGINAIQNKNIVEGIQVLQKEVPDIMDLINRIGKDDYLEAYKDEILNVDNKIYPRILDKKLKENYFPFHQYQEYRYRDYTTYGSFKKKEKEYKYHFKCQNGECRGFLDDKWICGVCSHLTCKDCLTAIGEIKNVDKPSEEKSYFKKIHGCKPEDIETANLLKKDSKPCPKCQTLIYRIDGCLQMFCTFCKTAFDWKTGEIVTKGIHNPHFFQWKNGQMKEFGVGEGEDPAQDTQLECCENNGFVHITSFPKGTNKYDFHIQNKGRHFILIGSQFDFLVGCRNHYNDLLERDYRLETMDNIHENEVLMKYRVDFLMGIIEEDEWKAKILVEENKCLRTSEIRQLIELFTFASGEILTKLRNFLTTNSTDNKEKYHRHYLEFIVESYNLFLYVESQFEKLQAFYNVVMPYFIKEMIDFIKSIDIPTNIPEMSDEEITYFLNKLAESSDIPHIFRNRTNQHYYYYNYYEDRRKKDISHLSKRKVRKTKKEDKIEEEVTVEKTI